MTFDAARQRIASVLIINRTATSRFTFHEQTIHHFNKILSDNIFSPHCNSGQRESWNDEMRALNRVAARQISTLQTDAL